MTQSDIEFAALALELLAEDYKDVVFTEAPDTDDYDPTTGRTTLPVTTWTVKSAPPFSYAEQMVNGNTVQADDLRLLIAGSGQSFVPTTTQQVAFDSKTFRIVAVRPYYSGDDIAAWEVQVRK